MGMAGHRHGAGPNIRAHAAGHGARALNPCSVDTSRRRNPDCQAGLAAPCCGSRWVNGAALEWGRWRRAGKPPSARHSGNRGLQIEHRLRDALADDGLCHRPAERRTGDAQLVERCDCLVRWMAVPLACTHAAYGVQHGKRSCSVLLGQFRAEVGRPRKSPSLCGTLPACRSGRGTSWHVREVRRWHHRGRPVGALPAGERAATRCAELQVRCCRRRR
jgi:hypothetical protein